MSWFDEQLNYREASDENNFSEALASVARAVMGNRLQEALDKRDIADNAIDAILTAFRIKPKADELPPEIRTVDEQIEYRLRPYGIASRNVRLEENWYKNASGPMLGTLKADGSAVALIPGRVSGYKYRDFKTGKAVRINRRTRKRLDAEAVCFYPPLPQRALTVGDLVRYTAGLLRGADVILFILILAASVLLGLLTPLMTKQLFGPVLESGETKPLLALFGFMVSYSVCRICFSACQALTGSRIATRQNVSVQAAVMNRILSLPAAFFKNHAAGELSQRAAQIQSICGSLVTSVAVTALTSVFSLTYIGQVFAFAPALVVPSILITLATVALSLLTTVSQARVARKQLELSAKTSGLTYATIRGIQKIKLAGAEKRMFSRWARLYAREAELDSNPPLFLKLSGTIRLTISLTGALFLYAMAVKSGVSVPDYYAFNASYGMASAAFMSLASIATTVAGIRPALESVRPILEAVPEQTGQKQFVTSLSGAIELNRVSFRYDESMPYVIDDLSLRIQPGEYVAVVGATGCGKSTLMRLLLGFETPQKGSIFYDKRNLKNLDLESLRRRIGTVMQDSRLFLGDIYSNITLTSPNMSLDDAWKAAEIAAVADDIREMPLGMSTLVLEGQGGISGGQRQRLLIARAVATRPKILMFDEATSALDNIAQKKVSQAIDGLKCTRIVIAHRLSTVCRADRILYLENGKIAEEGTYDELLKKNGLFAALVERQRLDRTTDYREIYS